MKKIFKYLMPAIPIFSYLLIPSNSSISNSFFPSYSKDPQTQHIIDSLNSANRQSQLERIAQFEEQKKLVEKIKKFNAEKDPIYLTEKELDTYINKLYKKGIAPKEISKQLFKEIIKKESGGNIYATHKETKARGLGQLLENAWNDTEKEISYIDGVYNPEKNLEVSLRYLRDLKNMLKKYNPKYSSLTEKEKAQQILASYNWGIGSLKEVNFNISRIPKETKKYLKKLKLI